MSDLREKLAVLCYSQCQEGCEDCTYVCNKFKDLGTRLQDKFFRQADKILELISNHNSEELGFSFKVETNKEEFYKGC